MAVAALATVAHRLNVPEPLVYVTGGILLSLVPRVAQITFDPNVVFLLFFPALLFGSAWSTSWNDFRPNWRIITSLSLSLVVITTVAIAVVARLLLDLPWAVCFLLGVILADPGTGVFSRVAARSGVPRPLATVLNGEGLVEGPPA